MQVLKEQVRSRIITSARAEFLNRGYAQASMRLVAERSDITVGNIYRYFSSKQSLFEEVVSPAYFSLKALLESVQIHEALPLTPEQYMHYREQFVHEIASAVEGYRDEILILFNGSEGTVFSCAMNDLSNLICKVQDKYVLDLIARRNSVQNLKALSRLISKGIVEAINDLVSRTAFNGSVQDNGQDNGQENGQDLNEDRVHNSDAVKSELRMIIDFYFRDLVTRFD